MGHNRIERARAVAAEVTTLYDTPADLTLLRPWTRIDRQRAYAANAARLGELLERAQGDGLGPVVAVLPASLPTSPAAAREAELMGMQEFYSHVATLGGVSTARAREQVRGVFAALIDSAGAGGVEQLVIRLYSELGCPSELDGDGYLDGEFLAKVCRYGRFPGTAEAERVTRTTLRLLAERISRTCTGQEAGSGLS